MTLATGQLRSDRRTRCAFTLIELILVLALLVVAVSIVAPRMSGFVRGRVLDSEARRLAAVMHAGEARAVSEGMPMMLWIDEKQNRYGLEQETPGQNGDAKAENFTAGESVGLAVLNAGTSGVTTFKDLPAIRFLADGSVDEGSPQTVRLQDSGGSALWLVETPDRRGYEIQDSHE
jgi:type II secretion system protein H